MTSVAPASRPVHPLDILLDLPRRSADAELWWDSSPIALPAWKAAFQARHPGHAAPRFHGTTTNPVLLALAPAADPSGLASWCRAHRDAGFRELQLEIARRSAAATVRQWEQTDGREGWVSLQVDPEHAFDADRMLRDAAELVALGPNVMVKVPGTRAGYAVIEELTARGVSTNNTLTFSAAQFKAYLDAVERGRARAPRTGPWRSVFTLMMSRITRTGDLVDEARARGMALSPTEQRWAEIAVLRRIQAMLRARGTPIKILLCSLTVDEVATDGARVSMHLEQTAGDPLVYTTPPALLDAIARASFRAEALPPRARARVPEDVLARLGTLRAFRRLHDPMAVTPEGMDALPPLVESLRYVLAAPAMLDALLSEVSDDPS